MTNEENYQQCRTDRGLILSLEKIMHKTIKRNHSKEQKAGMTEKIQIKEKRSKDGPQGHSSI